MILVAWNWKSIVLTVLGVGVLAAYFGLLAPVQERLEELAKASPVARAASQPDVADSFKGSDGRADAYVVVFLFVFLSPLALAIAVTLGLFLLSAAAMFLAPLIGGEKIAMLVVEIVGALVIYLERGVWLPHAMYYVGLLARAYVVITGTA